MADPKPKKPKSKPDDGGDEAAGGGSADPKPEEPKPKPRRSRQQAVPVITSNRFDVFVLCALSAALILGMILAVVLAGWGRESALSAQVVYALVSICMLSAGAIAGRFSARAAEPSRLEAVEKP